MPLQLRADFLKVTASQIIARDLLKLLKTPEQRAARLEEGLVLLLTPVADFTLLAALLTAALRSGAENPVTGLLYLTPGLLSLIHYLDRPVTDISDGFTHSLNKTGKIIRHSHSHLTPDAFPGKVPQCCGKSGGNSRFKTQHTYRRTQYEVCEIFLKQSIEASD